MATKNVPATVEVLVSFPPGSKYYELPDSKRWQARKAFASYISDKSTGVFDQGMPPKPPYKSKKPLEVFQWGKKPLEINVDKSTGYMNETGVRTVLEALIDERYQGDAGLVTLNAQQVDCVIVDGQPKCIHTDPLLLRNVQGAFSTETSLPIDGKSVVGNFSIALAWNP